MKEQEVLFLKSLTDYGLEVIKEENLTITGAQLSKAVEIGYKKSLLDWAIENEQKRAELTKEATRKALLKFFKESEEEYTKAADGFGAEGAPGANDPFAESGGGSGTTSQKPKKSRNVDGLKKEYVDEGGNDSEMSEAAAPTYGGNRVNSLMQLFTKIAKVAPHEVFIVDGGHMPASDIVKALRGIDPNSIDSGETDLKPFEHAAEAFLHKQLRGKELSDASENTIKQHTELMNNYKKSANEDIENVLTMHPLHKMAHELDESGEGFDFSKASAAGMDLEFCPPEVIQEVNRRHGRNYYPHYHTDLINTANNLHYQKSATNLLEVEESELHESAHRSDHLSYTKGQLGINQVYSDLSKGGFLNGAGGEISPSLLAHLKDSHGENYNGHKLAVPVVQPFFVKSIEEAGAGMQWDYKKNLGSMAKQAIQAGMNYASKNPELVQSGIDAAQSAINKGKPVMTTVDNKGASSGIGKTIAQGAIGLASKVPGAVGVVGKGAAIADSVSGGKVSDAGGALINRIGGMISKKFAKSDTDTMSELQNINSLVNNYNDKLSDEDITVVNRRLDEIENEWSNLNVFQKSEIERPMEGAFVNRSIKDLSNMDSVEVALQSFARTNKDNQ